MAEYADWVTEVSQNIFDVPRVTIISAVRNAAITFCSESLVWIEQLPTLTFDESQSTYTLDLPYNSVIEKIWTLDGFKKVLDTELNNRRNYRLSSNVIQFVEPSREYRFQDDQLIAIASLKPSRGSSSCPDFLLEHYFLPILSKALSNLASQPSAEWSTRPDLVALNEARYLEGVKKAISDRNDRLGMPLMPKTTKTYFL